MSEIPQRPILAAYEAFLAQPIRPGTLVDGVVDRVEDAFVIFSLESVEARAPKSDFAELPAVGATVRMYVEELDDEGIVLSRDKAARMERFARLEHARADGSSMDAKVLKAVRGGLSVSVEGVRAFLPGNRLGAPAGRLTDWIGRELPVRIMALDGFKGRVEVAAARSAVRPAPLPRADDAPAEQAVAPQVDLASIEVGAEITGEVKRLAKFGAFVDIGGVDGLVPNTELAWERIKHASEVVSPGQMLAVKVLSVDVERGRIGLSVKALQPDPWEALVESFPAGTQATGRVVGLTDYGAFVEVAPGVEGLVHISEMRWGAPPKHPSGAAKKGDTVEVVVLEADAQRKRLRLSMKQVAGNPWDALREKYPPGTRLLGPVQSVTDFGIFVGVEEGIDGLVHVSDMEWGQTVRDPKSRFAKGDEVEVMVLDVDMDRQRLSLGIKQLTSDRSGDLYAAYGVGAESEGTIVKVVDFGAFVALDGGVEGLVHKTGLSNPPPHSARDLVEVGQTVKVRVISLDVAAGKIGLTLAELLETPAPKAAVEPAADLVEPATEPEVEPAADLVEPAAEPVVEPAAEPVEPAAEPVVEQPAPAEAKAEDWDELVEPEGEPEPTRD